MLPMEVADRTFQIEFQGSSGTAFAFDRGGRQYLITAKHLVESLQGRSVISIWYDNGWKRLQVNLVGHGDSDVSVLAAETLLAHPDMILEPVIGGWYLGHDAFVVGFPLGLMNPSIQSLFPAPVLKRTAISGKMVGGNEAPFLLDSLSNAGFSGAPVYLKLHMEKTYKVAMIVSSSPTTLEPVYDADGADTGMTVHQDSGMTYAYSIKCALDIIDENPIGFLTSIRPTPPP